MVEKHTLTSALMFPLQCVTVTDEAVRGSLLERITAGVKTKKQTKKQKKKHDMTLGPEAAMLPAKFVWQPPHCWHMNIKSESHSNYVRERTPGSWWALARLRVLILPPRL